MPLIIGPIRVFTSVLACPLPVLPESCSGRTAFLAAARHGRLHGAGGYTTRTAAARHGRLRGAGDCVARLCGTDGVPGADGVLCGWLGRQSQLDLRMAPLRVSSLRHPAVSGDTGGAPLSAVGCSRPRELSATRGCSGHSARAARGEPALAGWWCWYTVSVTDATRYIVL